VIVKESDFVNETLTIFTVRFHKRPALLNAQRVLAADRSEPKLIVVRVDLVRERDRSGSNNITTESGRNNKKCAERST
jgi:hypothetical protein